MKNGGAIVLTRMLTDDDDDRQTDIMITIPLLPRGKKWVPSSKNDGGDRF